MARMASPRRSVQAYVLVEVRPGKTFQVREKVARIRGVRSAHLVTGPYDIIALVEASDLRALADMVVSRIQRAAGVERTITSVVVSA